jgi:alkanesulfonate monooxygenase SsuD/methylene tetrahydromethanopterin reductase-like flavin-dependent oxidoreductase (luciferase family)
VKYWELWGRYAQFTADGRLPEDYEVWRKRAPLLAQLSFDDIVERGLIFIGSPDTVAAQIRRHRVELDIHVLACVFKFGAMPLDVMLGSMQLFAEKVRPQLC